MKARIISGQAPGGNRTPLADVLPLATPLVVQIFPIYACNFSCEYCFMSTPKESRGFVTEWPVMKLDTFRKCVEDLAAFPDPLKVLRFVGMGEPLLHKEIAAMVAMAKESRIANRVEILTNGSLLNQELSMALIEAGLDRLVISLQGLTTEKYQRISHVQLDFDALVEQIRFFHQHKSNTHVYVKIVDYALDGPEDHERFYATFGDICDSMAIENAVPIMPGVDYDKVLPGHSKGETQFGLPVSHIDVCPQSFFTMQINPDGKVVPCYQIEYPGIMGDVQQNTLQEIWKGETWNAFRRAMLEGRDKANAICAKCNFIQYRLFPEDDLKDAVPRLKGIYG